jgi:hypothetical protein
MKIAPALAVALLAACAAPAPRPPPRVTDRAVLQVVQVGWMQLNPGQLNKPTVEDLRHGGRAPDPQGAEEIAQGVLEKCRKGAPMEPLQRQFSEADPGTVPVDAETKKPWRDAALTLQVGECALARGNAAFYVVKRVE